MRRRRRKPAAELTPLIDVLFIVLFAALIQARLAMEGQELEAEVSDAGVSDAGASDAGASDAGASDAGASDAGASDAGSVHQQRALAVASEIASAARHRDVFVVEVSSDGVITAMSRWHDGQPERRDRTDERLLRPVLPTESDRELTFGSAGAPERRICSLVRARFAQDQQDLGQALVLVVVNTHRDERPLALERGLAAHIASCFEDTGAVAILLDPEDVHD